MKLEGYFAHAAAKAVAACTRNLTSVSLITDHTPHEQKFVKVFSSRTIKFAELARKS